MLELRGPAVVGADCGPAVSEHRHPAPALGHPGLDGEGHAGQHRAGVGVPVHSECHSDDTRHHV